MERNSKERYCDNSCDLYVYPRSLMTVLTVQRLHTIPRKWNHPHLWMYLKVHEPVRTPYIHEAFHVAELEVPFIGVDLLSHFGPHVDCRNNRLLEVVTSLSMPGLIAPLSVSSVKAMAEGTNQTASRRNCWG